jgi:hypothetical protein
MRRTGGRRAAALAAALLGWPLAGRAQLQLAPPLTPPAPAAPLPAPSPLAPPAPTPLAPATPEPPPPESPPQQPPPLPLVFPPPAAGTPEAVPPGPSNAPPAAPQAPATAPPGAQPLQPPAPAGPAPLPAPAGPAPLPAAPNLWVPAHAAQLDVLNKIDSRTRRLSIKAGQSATFGTITIAVKSCDLRPPNQAPDAAAWLDITDSDPKAVSFHGWMLAREPAVSVLQSPVYDVHLTGCA